MSELEVTPETHAAITLITIPDNRTWFAKLMDKLFRANTGWSGNNWQGTGGL